MKESKSKLIQNQYSQIGIQEKVLEYTPQK